MATHDHMSIPPLSQQMDAEEPDIGSNSTGGFDPICNFYAYNGKNGQCLYDVCCPFCVYGDNRVIDEVLQGLPDTLNSPASRIISVAQSNRHHTNICCLPGCWKHCLFLYLGAIPSILSSLVANPGCSIFVQLFYRSWKVVVGGRNRKHLKDKYRITQPKCVLAGCSCERMEPYCCWFWNPLVRAQEARFLRRKFKQMTEDQIDVMIN